MVGWIGRAVFSTQSTHDVVAAHRVIELLDSLQAAANDARNGGHASGLHEGTLSNVDTLIPSDVTDRPRTPHKSSASSASVHVRVRINTASRAVLMRLPGVGPSTADKMIAERSIRPFQSVEDLTRVKGIGPKRLEKLRDFVLVP